MPEINIEGGDDITFGGTTVGVDGLNVNSDLVPSGSGTVNLGEPAKSWRTIYVDTIISPQITHLQSLVYGLQAEVQILRDQITGSDDE